MSEREQQRGAGWGRGAVAAVAAAAVESENSNGFHAPQESARLLGEAIDQFRQGQVALRPRLVGESR